MYVQPGQQQQFYGQQPQQQQPQQQQQQQMRQQQQQQHPKAGGAAPLADDPNARLDYSKKKWNDVWATVLFIVHIIVICVLFATQKPKEYDENDSDTPKCCSNPDHEKQDSNGNEFCVDDDGIQSNATNAQCPDLDDHFKALFAIAAGTLVVACVTAALWLAFIKRNAVGVIKIGLGLVITLWAVFALVLFANGVVIGGIMCALIAALTAWYAYAVRHRIPFAGACVSIGTQCIQDYPAPVYLSFGFIPLQFGWQVFWLLTTIKVIDAGSNGGLLFLMFISFFWTAYVLTNILHVTTAGVMGTWYFSPEPKAPTKNALVRAMTTSFGSICFGSLLVAVISAIKAMLKSQKNRNNFCLICIIDCIEKIAKFFNTYAFCRVAIYGDDFITAAKGTWAMFKAKGMETLVNDDLTSLPGLLGCLAGAILCGAGGYGVASAWPVFKHNSDTVPWTIIAALVAFIIGFFTVALVMKTLQSAVATLFVCWSDDPQAFSQSRPQHFNKFVAAYNQRYGQQ